MEKTAAPPGHEDPPGTIHIDLQKAAQRAAGGLDTSRLRQDYPAHQPAQDPLSGMTRADESLVYADPPLTQTINDWDVDQIRNALVAHNYGIFFESGLLIDTILGDPRVQATLGSLTSALFGREVIITPANESIAAKECAIAWEAAWPRLSSTSTFTQLAYYAKLGGWSPAQAVWDTSKTIWQPELRPWHLSYSYYHWDARRYVAISRDGPIAMIPGNGKWVVHFPFGDYRGWIRGAVRAVAEPWLLRHQAFIDHARFSEVHGLPIRKAIVPAASDQGQRDRYVAKVAALGSETTVMVQKGVDGNIGYDLELLEATDDAWQCFPGLIDRCDMDIVLAIMFQNLTTEVDGGAFAATKSHMDVRDQSVAYDNFAWAWTIYSQLARPFAWLNFGDANLAPMTRWNTTPRSELAANAEQFGKFGAAIGALRAAGIEFTDPEEIKKFAANSFGLKGLPNFKIVEPTTGSRGGESGGTRLGGGGGPTIGAPGTPGAPTTKEAYVSAVFEAWQRGQRAA